MHDALFPEVQVDACEESPRAWHVGSEIESQPQTHDLATQERTSRELVHIVGVSDEFTEERKRHVRSHLEVEHDLTVERDAVTAIWLLVVLREVGVELQTQTQILRAQLQELQPQTRDDRRSPRRSGHSTRVQSNADLLVERPLQSYVAEDQRRARIHRPVDVAEHGDRTIDRRRMCVLPQRLRSFDTDLNSTVCCMSSQRPTENRTPAYECCEHLLHTQSPCASSACARD